MDKWQKRFLDLAKQVSTWSKDPSTQTGAVIVRPDLSVVSIGYNGFPRAMEDKSIWLDNREEKYSRIIHCEMNALIQAKTDVTGCTLYTYPFLSCDRCFVHLVQAGIDVFIAPLCPPDKAERWEPAFKKVRGYAEDMGIIIHEVPYE